MNHPETDQLTDRLHKQEAPLVVRYQEMTMHAQKLESRRDDGSMFAADILSRAVIDEETAKKFRRASKQVILRDPITAALVVCYRHPDGRVLLDAIRLQGNASVEARQ